MNTTDDVSKSLYLNSPLDRGPILRGYRRRAFFIWLTLALCGLLPSLLQWAPGWQAAGLGLWFPGGGFLLAGSPVLMFITVVLFVVALFSWLLMGGFIFPVIIWGGSIVLAALDVGDSPWAWALYVTPMLSIGVITLVLFKEKQRIKRAKVRAEVLKTMLANVPYREPDPQAIVDSPLTDQEIGAMRYCLDLCLQPLDEFKGFVTKDQFREAGWRYQLVTLNYALAMLQTCRMPAFHGYLHEAQRNAIIKMKDKRVWKYWRIENFVGNLKLDADPIKSENIMYSGWWGLAIGAFERATGDLQYSQTGALSLQENPKKRYVYDYSTMMDAVGRNFEADKLCLFPCEPNWVFTICNLFGITGMLAFDKVHGTNKGLNILDRFNQMMEQEFMIADGRAVVIASKRSGFVFSSDMPLAHLSNAQMLNMTCPRHAQVCWAIGKYLMAEQYGDDLQQWGMGEKKGIDAGIDAGNYEKNNTTLWICMMRGAKEMGDDDVYDYAKKKYDAMGITEQDGVLYWQGSVLNQATAHMAQFANKDAWYRLIHGDVPAAISSGPVLKHATYPEVLVAAANNDGAALDLVLCAGGETAEQTLSLARLQPEQSYRIESTAAAPSQIIADAEGNAELVTLINKRTTLHISLADG